MKKLMLLVIPALLIAAGCTETGKTGDPAGNVLSDSLVTAYLNQGKAVAQATFEALSSELKARMQAGGPVAAVEYCQLAAYPLTDSMAQTHEAVIRRTSHRYRNPANAPTSAESATMDAYLSMKDNGSELQPQIYALGTDSVQFFAPIVTKPLCLTCHGIEGETLNPELAAHIRSLYPEDQATGFGEGDLRGIWSIKMKRTDLQ